MKTIEGCLVSQGVRVQRAKLRNSLKRVDPVGRRLRSYTRYEVAFTTFALLCHLSTRRFLRGDGNRKSNLLPIHVSRRHGQPSRLCADFVLLILTSPVKREFRLYDFRAFTSFCPQCFVLIDA